MTAITIVAFNYDALSPALASEAIAIADKIRSRMKGGYLATGHDLIDMKSKLGHGKFGAWLASEFGMTARTAERYMAAATFETKNSDIMSDLLPATMYRLSAPSLPPTARDECVALAKSGKVLSEADVKAIASAHSQRAREEKLAQRSKRKSKVQREMELADLETKFQERAKREERAERQKEELADILLSAVPEQHDRIALLLRALAQYDIGQVLLDRLQVAA